MDIFFRIKKSYILAGCLAGSACIFMVAFPQVALLSAQKGISLWASSVLPALLPFFICANFLNYLGVTKALRPSFFPFAMSVMSGYPMGAKIIGDMGRSRAISTGEAKRLLSFCSTSGPTFMVGAVGVGMLGSTTAGVVIALSHYAGALVNGFLFSRKKESGTISVCRETHKKIKKDSDLLEILTDAMLASFKSLGIILAYLVIFMFVTDIIQFAGLLNIVDLPFEKGLLKGLLEMTVGCASLASCTGITLEWKCILCTFLISFGGMSVIGQSMSMLSGLKISIFYFMFMKLCHALLAVIFAFILLLFVV